MQQESLWMNKHLRAIFSQCGMRAGGLKNRSLIFQRLISRVCPSFQDILVEMEFLVSTDLSFGFCSYPLPHSCFLESSSPPNLRHPSHCLRYSFLGMQIKMWVGRMSSWYHYFLSLCTPQSLSTTFTIIPSNLNYMNCSLKWNSQGIDGTSRTWGNKSFISKLQFCVFQRVMIIILPSLTLFWTFFFSFIPGFWG